MSGAGYMCLFGQGFTRTAVRISNSGPRSFFRARRKKRRVMKSILLSERRHRSNDFRYDDERLRFVLRASGLTTGLFAREIGLPDSELIYRIKSGKAPLGAEIAGRIHRCYPQIDICWLLTGEVAKRE